MESLIFIYSMPGYSCSVKERMMYSSCKAPFLDTIQQLGLDITKKVIYFTLADRTLLIGLFDFDVGYFSVTYAGIPLILKILK